jgi:hypothetical protein
MNMDNATLLPLVQDARERQFWFKPFGDPKNPIQAAQTFSHAIEEITFAKRPNTLQLDDILIVYAVGISKILFVADYYTPPKQITTKERPSEEWRNRWSWSIRGHNFTPTYGSKWINYNLRPFDLVKEYNDTHVDDMQNLGSLQFGSDKQRISKRFANFIFEKILQLQ